MQLALIQEPKGDAEFSPCGLYRKRLWRPTGAPGDRQLTVIGLNPSIAGKKTAEHPEGQPDPTSTRQIERARRLGCSLLMMVNIFDWIDTDPEAMKRAAEPSSPDNDAVILAECQRASLIICGWGNDGAHRGRGAAVAAMLRQAGHRLHYLRLTKRGEPEHPLYLSYKLTPQEWTCAPPSP